jgi:hypothetical protein
MINLEEEKLTILCKVSYSECSRVADITLGILEQCNNLGESTSFNYGSSDAV